MSAKPVVYRVETYFVPHANRFPIQSTISEVDDTKIKSQLNIKHNNTCEKNGNEEETSSGNERVKFLRCLAENSRSIGTKTVRSVINENEIILDKQFDNDDNDDDDDDDDEDDDIKHYAEDFYYCDDHIKTQRTELKTLIGAEDTLYPSRQFRRHNSLMSIDERSEDSEIKLHDFCRHGYQNGCTATIPSPEEVSEEVFKENWLQKIEILRQREIVLKKREMQVQDREKQVFKKEKELRIMDRVLKERLKQVEQQLKRHKNVETVQKRLERTTRILDSESLDEFSSKVSDEQNTKTEKPKNSQLPVDLHEKDKESDRKPSFTRSRNYASLRQPSSSNLSTNVNSYSNMRYKQRRKISYDDMDSTLSADIGDSSFVRTSELFNPELFKKPYAFTRSASMRQPKHKPQPSLEEKHIIEENRILQKQSENTCSSQNRDIQFQSYGFVDHLPEDLQNKVEYNANSEGKLFSQHNPEISDKLSYQRSVGSSKDGSLSWNEETNKWLQKKRQAYNLTIQKSIEDKENLKCNSVTTKDNKASKKDIKNKIFTIFR